MCMRVFVFLFFHIGNTLAARKLRQNAAQSQSPSSPIAMGIDPGTAHRKHRRQASIEPSRPPLPWSPIRLKLQNIFNQSRATYEKRWSKQMNSASYNTANTAQSDSADVSITRIFDVFWYRFAYVVNVRNGGISSGEGKNEKLREVVMTLAALTECRQTILAIYGKKESMQPTKIK